jgi:hypothetical protein
MKRSKFAVLACILVCAFMVLGFVGRASAATTKVTVTPSKPAVKFGGTQQFKAKVTGVNGATVTWSIDQTSVNNGCTISSSGLLSVPTTVTPDSWKPVVTATYAGTSTVTGTATFTITDPAPAPGLLIGTISCTGGSGVSCSGNNYDLAFNLSNKGKIDALVIDGTLGNYTAFKSAILLKNNTVTGHYNLDGETYTLEGYVDYNGGNVADIKGELYTAGEIDSIGTWEVILTTTGLAKEGTFSITDKSLFGAVVSGTLAGMTTDPNSNAIYGAAYVPRIKQYIPASGTYDQTGNSVSFSFSYNGNDFTANGTFSPNGQVSGDLLSGGVKVGTWQLRDI